MTPKLAKTQAPPPAVGLSMRLVNKPPDDADAAGVEGCYSAPFVALTHLYAAQSHRPGSITSPPLHSADGAHTPPHTHTSTPATLGAGASPGVE